MTSTTSPPAARERVPSVLVVLAVRDAAEWLRESLQALAGQRYPRLAIVAVDDASTDGSHEILVQALGEGRVVRNEEALGLARSFDRVMSLPMATEADYLLLLHDDAVLDEGAVQRLVEAARMPGVEGVGIVGAKVVDREQPRRLRDVGRSADRFGHPYTPLQAGEIDQGQFDRMLDVLAVDPCAMLVARDVWQRVGLFDERLGEDGDVDLCWRTRVAGWRVLMTPLARVRHRGSGERGERIEERSRRYEEDRAALASVLKNYGPFTLLWVAPLGLLLTFVRLLFLLLSRRFEEALDVVHAVGWNLLHLPGTLLRRRRVQRSRRISDHALRRFTESAGLRLPRWFQTAERIWEEQREFGEQEHDEAAPRRLRHRTASLASTHPVIVASFVGAAVGAFAVRHLLGPETVSGGVVPAFPPDPTCFFAELVSATRTTPLGGPLAASPGLAAMGGLSLLALGSTALAQKAMLILLPVLAATLCYRAAARLTRRPGPAVVAASAYGLSAVALWAFSDGRLGTLAALAAMPSIVERIDAAFDAVPTSNGRWRSVVGLGVTLAVATTFWPGVLLATFLVLVVELVLGRSRGRGLGIVAGSIGVGAVLLFPFVPTLLASGGAAFGSEIGGADPWAIGRLVLGEAPGSWGVAWFLPAAAALGLALSSGERRRPALRMAVVVLGAYGLAWLSAAGYLPAALSNAPAFVALAAVGEAFLVACGLSSAVRGLDRAAFGFRQIGTVAVAAVLTGGIALQVVAAALGEWAVGPGQTLASWEAVVDRPSTDDMRVLWLGADDGRPFPAPGGDPASTVEAGPATARFGLTDRRGTLAIDTARPLAGSGTDALVSALEQILGGDTHHGGALLAPFAVRYVVAGEGELPDAARAKLEDQSDLDLVPATGLVVYRNAVELPPAAAYRADAEFERLVTSDRPQDLQRLTTMVASPLSQVEGGWEGPTSGGDLVVVSTAYDGAWELVGTDEIPERSFGWSTSFTVEGSYARIRYGAQLPRTVEMWLLAALWVAALWITRKPVQR